MKGKRVYKKFHGKNPNKTVLINFDIPEELIYLGDVKAIEYESNKKHGGGDGKKHLWRHDFRSKVKLCCDGKRNRLFLIDGKINVKRAGITG